MLEQDFARLGAGPSIDRQYWLAQMQSAVSAASHYLPSLPASQSEQRGTIRRRRHSGLDITSVSNLAKRARL